MDVINLSNVWRSSDSALHVVDVTNVQFSGTTNNNGIYKTVGETLCTITANMVPRTEGFAVPATTMTVMISKVVRGTVVDELPFDATLIAADGAEPAKLSLPVKLPAGFYEISAARINQALANPKIDAPFRLSFETLDIDVVRPL